MKKVISLLMFLVMLLSMTAGLSLTANADTVSDSDFAYSLVPHENGEYTVSVCGYYGNETDLIIPSKIAGKTVTEIYANPDFDSNDGNLKYLNSITIPETVENYSNENFFFSYCTNLKAIYVNENNKYFSSQDGVLFNKDKSQLIRYPINKQDVSYAIPESVDCMSSDAFSNCRNITNIAISSDILCFGDGSRYYINGASFNTCSDLSSFTVSPDNKNYSSEDGVLFNKDKTKLLSYPVGKANAAYSIPNSVTNIGRYAFSKCTNLTSLTIPSSVTNIEDFAFFDSAKITDVYYSGSLSEWNSIEIYNNMMSNKYLKNATIHCTDGVINEKPNVDPTPDPTPTPTPTPTPEPKPTPTPSQPATSAPTTTATVPATQPTTQATIASTTEVPVTTKAEEKLPKNYKKSGKDIVNTKQKKASFKKVTAAKASTTIAWAKVKGVKGYEIQLATDKKFGKNKKSVTIKKQATTKTTVKNLKSKTTYYVRIRTFKTQKINGKSTKIYSNWSKISRVKTK